MNLTPLRVAIILVGVFALMMTEGCVSRNSAEINAVKIERKPSAADEANKWADVAAKIFRPTGEKP